MAVEARHMDMNIFPQQIITNRDFVNSNQFNNYGYNNNNATIGSGNVVFTGTTMADNLLPLNQSMICDSVHAKTSLKAESGVTYNLPSVPRKRSRDSMNQFNSVAVPQNKSNFQDFSSIFGEQSFPVRIQQQQLEMDQIIAQHTKKIRLELEERQKQQARIFVSAIGEGVVKKLKEKDEQIHKMAKLNMALQDRLKSLFVENQLWKDLAQSNEATVMSLRCNLEQVLSQITDEPLFPAAGNAAAEEAESCCGSSDDKEGNEIVSRRVDAGTNEEKSLAGNRKCRKCGERESCVLLLPCRHLCLCAVCGTTLQSTCPVCNSTMNATVHVNISD